MKSIIPQSFKNIYHLLKALGGQIYFGFPAKNIKIIGVTGTDGKTSTSTMVYHILKKNAYKVALISTVAAYIEDELIETGLHVTSPDSWDLLQLIKKISSRGIDHIVLEVTSHGLDQHRIFGIKPEVALYTNITHEHLDYHKTLKNYILAKAKLAKNSKHLIYNKNDEHSSKLPILTHSRKIHTYGLDASKKLANDLKNIKEDYNLLNAAGAIMACAVLGVETKKAIDALKTFPGIPGRMEHIKNSRDITVIVDFAHTPNALKEALTSIKANYSKSKIIAVFGAAGKRDYQKRPMMGEIASKIADEIILTSEDPRDEDPRVIIHQIKDGAIKNHGHIHAIIDRSKAIDTAINKLAKKGDVVAIFGKGHEKSLNMDGKKEIPWSDALEAKKALEKST